MTNDIEAAARAYLAAYDVESSNSEMWYRAVVDARDALRAALAEATEPAPKPEGCPTCGETDPLVVLQMDRRERKTESMLVRCHDRFHDTHPPTPAEGRGEEAGRDRCGPMSFGVVDCDGVLYADSRENAERRVRVLNDSGIAGTPYRVVPLYARSIQHGDGGGKEA